MASEEEKEKPLSPNEKIAKCIKEHQNWGLLKPENRFDNPAFDPKATFESLNSTSPKLLELINNIKKLDEKDMQKHGKLFKHFIYSDIKSAFGAKLIASGLASAGFHHAYKLKKTSRGMSFAVDLGSAKKQNSFATLTSVSFFEKPIGITFRKDLLAVYNKRPDNIYGEQIRIIILDSGFREGIDLFDVKYVHLFEPIATVSDETQAIGRATRFCGQKGLEFDSVYGWPLHVYRYETVIPADIQKYMDGAAPLLAPADSFFKLFMKFSNIDPKKLTFANELQRVIREVAVDKKYTVNVHDFKIPSRKRSSADSQHNGGANGGAGSAKRHKRPSVHARKMDEPSRSSNSLTTAKTPTINPVSDDPDESDPDDLEDLDDESHEQAYEENVDEAFQDRAEDDAVSTNEKFMWKEAKVENLCVSPPAANKSKEVGPAKNYEILKFGPTQDFVRTVFTPKSPLHGMLLNHSVGTGKSCTAIGTASSSFEKEDYTIIYVTRYTLKPDVWKNMFGQICSVVVQEYLAKGKSLPEAHAARMRLISKKWIEPMSYRQLSNMLEGKNSFHDILVKNNGKTDILNKTLIIIDEAHKLFASDVEGQEKADVDAIRKAFHHSFTTSGKDAVKVLMMTATPYTSDPMDMMRLVNLMRTPANALPETFEEFSTKFLDETGAFSESGLEKFSKAVKGMISYLNRGKDIRSFAYPVFHSIKAQMSDYEYIDSIESYHKILKKWKYMKEMLDNNIKNIHARAAFLTKQLKEILEKKFKKLIDDHKSCLENVKKFDSAHITKAYKENLKTCKVHIAECKEKIKAAYKKRIDDIKAKAKEEIKDLKDEMKDIKKQAKKDNKDYDYSDIENEIAEIETKLVAQVEKLKRDESFDITNCDSLNVYTRCIKNAEETYQKELEKGKTLIEAEKAKCAALKTNLDKIMAEETVRIKATVDEFVKSETDKLDIDKERVANAKTDVDNILHEIRDAMANDQSQRTALDKCLAGKLPSAAKKLLNGQSLITLDDEIITPSVHDSDKKKQTNIFLINGHGSENPIDFNRRYTMPPNNALVIFPVCSRPNYMNYGCKTIEMFRNPKYKKLLMNPVKYRKEIADYIGQDLRIFLPGDSVPSLSSDLFLKFDKFKNNNIVFAKSGVFRIDNISDFDRNVLPEPTRAYNLGSDSCIKQCGIISGPNDFTTPVYKQVYKDNIYPPARKGTTYTDFERNSHKIRDIMKTVGDGIYYYIGCRSSFENITMEKYMDILDKSEKQQEMSHRSKKIKSLVENLIREKESGVDGNADEEKSKSKSKPSTPKKESEKKEEDKNKDKNKDDGKKGKRKIIKLNKLELEKFKSCVDELTKYMEMVDKTGRIPNSDTVNELITHLKELPQATAVLKVLKEAAEIKYIVDYYKDPKNTFTTVLRVVNNKNITEVYLSRQIMWDKKKIHTQNILQGVIPNNIKETELKCNSSRIIDYLKKRFKNGEENNLDLPFKAADWNASEIKRICKLIQ